MDGELSTGMKILLVIVLICIVIGIVFGIFAFITSNTEESQGGMEQSVASMQASEMNKYDQTELSGSATLSAISFFKGQDFAVVVSNKKHGANDEFGTGAKQDVYGMNVTGSKITPPGSGAGADPQFAKVDGLDPATTAGVGKTATEGFRANDLSAAKDSSHVSYIRATAKYNSYLIKDAGEQVVGVYLVQVK